MACGLLNLSAGKVLGPVYGPSFRRKVEHAWLISTVSASMHSCSAYTQLCCFTGEWPWIISQMRP